MSSANNPVPSSSREYSGPFKGSGFLCNVSVKSWPNLSSSLLFQIERLEKERTRQLTLFNRERKRKINQTTTTKTHLTAKLTDKDDAPRKVKMAIFFSILTEVVLQSRFGREESRAILRFGSFFFLFTIILECVQLNFKHTNTTTSDGLLLSFTRRLLRGTRVTATGARTLSRL